MKTTDCPGCQTPTTAEMFEEITSDAVFLCGNCGYLGVWGGDTGWRVPTPEEHALLLQDEDYLRIQEQNMALRSWRERDRAKLHALVEQRVRCGTDLAARVLMVEQLVADLVAAGYHTHPTDGELRALMGDPRAQR